MGWLNSTEGSVYSNNVQWVNPSDPSQGVSNIKIADSALVAFEGEGSGKKRYEVYYTMRKDIKEIIGGSATSAFPYTANFLYWEEVGVVDSELIRNLIIAFGVVCTIIALLIPKPRIASFVALNIAMAIVEVIGFSHFWGVTMNGVSTIYFLMCAGFSVDYSAHIAHAFNSAGGSSSFVFEVFFKVLCLVCIVAGAHGIWLLPTMLSIIGGDAEASSSKKTPDQEEIDAKAINAV